MLEQQQHTGARAARETECQRSSKLSTDESAASGVVTREALDMRSTEQVIRDHLERRAGGDVEGDILHNYGDELTVLAKDGVFYGKDGIRHTAEILAENLPDATLQYDLLQIAGRFALLSWSAAAKDGRRTCHGADSFVVEKGRIVAQTIHYEVRS